MFGELPCSHSLTSPPCSLVCVQFSLNKKGVNHINWKLQIANGVTTSTSLTTLDASN